MPEIGKSLRIVIGEENSRKVIENVVSIYITTDSIFVIQRTGNSSTHKLFKETSISISIEEI